jgi:hypothetical protein
MSTPTHFTGTVLDQDIQSPEPEEVDASIQDAFNSLESFHEYQEYRRLDESE